MVVQSLHEIAFGLICGSSSRRIPAILAGSSPEAIARYGTCCVTWTCLCLLTPAALRRIPSIYEET